MRIRTNAKVNLLLSVRDRRPDGYHEIETVLQSISLADDLTLSTTSTRAVDVRMRAPVTSGEVPPERDNLVYAAARELIRRGARNDGVAIDITKTVPVGAGLGGGSANAAGALRALNHLWNAGLSERELVDVAARVGSDVPACVLGGTVLARGRGESVGRLDAPVAMWFVLGISDAGLSTADVYGRWQPRSSEGGTDSGAMVAALADGDVERVAGHAHNDLEAAATALRPELGARKRALADAGALAALVSGSGPTVFGIARDEVHARSIAEGAAPAFDRVEVVSSRPRCVEPGDGAELALD